MGKKGQQAWDEAAWYGYAAASSGAWPGQPWKPKQGRGNAGGTQSIVEMNYDQVIVEDKQEPKKDDTAPITALNVTQQIQKALNASRKATGKVRKLEEEKRTKVLQWQEYQKQLRASYNKQFQKHGEDLDKLDSDMAAAHAAAEEAEEKLRAITQQNPEPAEMLAGIDMDAEDDPWNSFMIMNEDPQAVEDAAVAEQ